LDKNNDFGKEGQRARERAAELSKQAEKYQAEKQFLTAQRQKINSTVKAKSEQLQVEKLGLCKLEEEK
jgi:hypothetical protein